MYGNYKRSPIPLCPWLVRKHWLKTSRFFMAVFLEKNRNEDRTKWLSHVIYLSSRKHLLPPCIGACFLFSAFTENSPLWGVRRTYIEYDMWASEFSSWSLKREFVLKANMAIYYLYWLKNVDAYVEQEAIIASWLNYGTWFPRNIRPSPSLEASITDWKLLRRFGFYAYF